MTKEVKSIGGTVTLKINPVRTSPQNVSFSLTQGVVSTHGTFRKDDLLDALAHETDVTIIDDEQRPGIVSILDLAGDQVFEFDGPEYDDLSVDNSETPESLIRLGLSYLQAAAYRSKNPVALRKHADALQAILRAQDPAYGAESRRFIDALVKSGVRVEGV